MSKRSDIIVPPPPPPQPPPAPRGKKNPAGKNSVTKKKTARKRKTKKKEVGSIYTPVHPNSLYNDQFCDEVIKHAKQGLSYESFAGAIGVDVETLKAWERHFPRWVEAKNKADAAFLYSWEVTLGAGVRGKFPKFSAAGASLFLNKRMSKYFGEAAGTSSAYAISPQDAEKANDPLAAARAYEQMLGD